MKTRLIIVRHAEAQGNLKRIFHGWTDQGITEKGHIQAKLAAEKLKDIDVDVIYASPLIRTQETAGYISKVKNLPIINSENLKEINGGKWEGVEWIKLPDTWPKEHDTWENTPHAHQMPDGESMKDFQQRLFDEIMNIVNENKGRNICIVTHGTAIRTLMCKFKHVDIENMINIAWCDNTAITIVEYDHKTNRFNVVLEGDATHLSKEHSTVQNQAWWDEHKNKIDNAKE